MIIERKCEVPEMVRPYIEVIFPNEYNLDKSQVVSLPIKRDGVIVGTMTHADEKYIYGLINSGFALFNGDLSKAEFTYYVEVERKPMSPLEKILDDNSKSMNLYYKAMDAIHKAKKEKEND